ncbi:MAG: hypothetical protein L0Y45_04545 [Woeseiaceae bacterium]|nr:hypothetical protein [Woeseiaceae bacterium]
MSGAPDFLVDLDALESAAIAGSKAFNLGRMARMGLPTPGGFAIPDSVFQQHLQNARVLQDLADLHAGLPTASRSQLDIWSASIGNRISGTGLAAGLLQALHRETQKRWPRQKLAVRSSAVGEDSVRSSFAGQLGSQLDVDTLPALETAIRSTWASLFSPRVLVYARQNRLDLRHMGVIVQPQVAARLSGVLFTRDPTGRLPGDMVLEYVSGLGERLVGGEVTPSRLRIDRSTSAVSAEFIAPESGVPDARTIAAVIELADYGLQLETRDGIAQDIEWCVDRDDRVMLVQSRPVTGTAHGRASPQYHWSNANIAENFPEPVSPFLFSIVRPGYSAYFRNLGLGFGLSRRRIDGAADAFDNIVGLQGGRLYYNLSNIHWLLQMMPGGRRLTEYFNLFVGAEGTPATVPAYRGRLSLAFECVRIAASVLWQYLFIQRRVRRFENRIDDFAASTHPSALQRKNADALAADLSAFLKIRMEYWNDAALADTAAMVCYGLLKARLKHWLGEGDQTVLHNDLLKGLPGLASAMPVTRLWELSRRIAGNGELQALFTNHGAEEILRGIRQPAFQDFANAFDTYLERWGFRSSAELMLTTPTPVEDPRPLVELLRAYLRPDTTSPEARAEEQAKSRLAASAAIEARITPVSWRRAVPLLSAASRFRLLLRATQGAIRLRERARMKQALLYTRLRHIALQLGDRLVGQRLLQQRDDIFMLTTDEVFGLVSGAEADAKDVAATVSERCGVMQACSAMQPPDRIVLGAGEAWHPAAAPHTHQATAGHSQEKLHGDLLENQRESLHGFGACGGAALGNAAVVLDVAQAGRVEAGQILVTRQTDPGWATVFFLVRGLVIERGGMLSHGAIIAREYGIPAVIGVPDATRLIRDGDPLRVDGDRGLVEFGHG